MQKTRKSIAKRVKVTGRGKLVVRSPGKRHLMRNKSTDQKRSMSQDHVLSESIARTFRHAIKSGKNKG
ncbi:MAG: 50S ribosomal protein L35 [Verrucomicrobiota bacterium]